MAADPRRILVVRAGALGDTLMATPVLPALAARHPGAAIDFLASAAAAPLLEQHPLLRRVYRLRWRNLPYALSLEQRRLVRAWRREPYDVAVVLEQAPQYRALVERAGPARVLGFHVTPFDPARHSIVNNLRAAGIAEPCAPPDMALPLSPADLTRADALVGGAGEPLAGLHAGYGPARWRRKQQQEARLRGWPAERFAAVGRALAARGYRIVLTGSAADRRLVRRIAARLPPETTIDLAGRTGPRELAAVIARLAVLVSVDSGPAHMAAAVGTPLVVLWGPGIFEQTRPVSSRTPIAILRRPPPCAPCYGTAFMSLCRRNVCMEAIAPADVVEAIEAVTARSSPRRPASPECRP